MSTALRNRHLRGAPSIGSPEQAAILHILTCSSIEARTARYLAGDDIDWAGLIAEADTMSTGEALLIRIAYDLAEPDSVVGVWEVSRRLDTFNFERVLEALRISRGLDNVGGPEVLRDTA